MLLMNMMQMRPQLFFIGPFMSGQIVHVYMKTHLSNGRNDMDTIVIGVGMMVTTTAAATAVVGIGMMATTATAATATAATTTATAVPHRQICRHGILCITKITFLLSMSQSISNSARTIIGTNQSCNGG